jgi:hypothetical protein
VTRRHRVYVECDGLSWSLTPEACSQLVEMHAAGQPWDLNILGRRLKHRRSKWWPSHRIGQWCDEDWADALHGID